MASVINAARNLLSDKWWVVKLFVLTVPVFYILQDEYVAQTIFKENIHILIGLFMLYLGCSSVIMNRNINNKSPLMPGIFTIPEVIIKAIGSSIVAFPGIAILIIACYFIHSYVVLEEPFAMFILYICVISFLVPFIIVPTVLYSVNGSIADGLKLNKVFEASGNFIVAFLAFVIQYFFIVILLSYLIYRLLFEMLGDGNIGISILYSFVIVLSFLLIFSYSSDLYEDVIPAVKSRRDIL